MYILINDTRVTDFVYLNSSVLLYGQNTIQESLPFPFSHIERCVLAYVANDEELKGRLRELGQVAVAVSPSPF